MKVLNLSLSLALALVAPGSPLRAQGAQDLDFFMKIRALAGMESKEGQRNGFGLGFGTSLQLGPGGLGLEAGYTFLPGAVLRAEFPNTYGYTQANSVLTRKHTVDLIGVRGQYTLPLAADCSWHAGLGLYHSKARMETVGDFEAKGNGGVWNSTPEKSGLSLMPFLGLGYRFSESGSIELNLTACNYKLADVQPRFNSPTAPDWQRVTPVYGDKSVTALKVEFAYAFHF